MEQELSRALTKHELVTLEKLKNKWKELSIEDIILDGLYSKCIRLVREYLEKYVKIDLKPNKITEIGLKTVVQLLLDKDLVGAEFLLNQMNFDVNQKLYQICFFTPYKQLRDYLISILVERKQLNDNELDMIAYLRRLEIAYPSQSLISVNELISPFKMFDSTKQKHEHFICKDLVQVRDSSASNRYAQIILEWIKNWSIEDREKILAESIILDPSKNTELKVAPKIIWSVLMEQDNLTMLCDWIDGKESILFSQPVDQEMIDSIEDNQFIPDWSKEFLLNHLAKKNKFTQNEKENFNKYLDRIISSETLFNKEFFAQRDDQFHINFITYFNSYEKIPDFVWTYLDLYNEIKKKPIQDLLKNTQLSNNLKMMLSFHQEPKDLLDLSLKNMEYCLDSSKTLSLSDMFSPEHKEFNLTALALSLNSETSINDANIDHLIDEFPALNYLTNSKSLDEPPTVYELLHNHSAINVGRFFQWQKSNKFCDELSTSESNNQILSFENEEFAKKYSYKDSLDYSYFLKQHRPFYAYYFLMKSMYERFGKTKKTIIEEARLRAHLIVINDFQNYRTVSSGVHFTELIDSDSFKLKLNVHLMSMLFDYYVKQGMEEEMAREKCKSVFTDFFMEEIEANEILSLFENIVMSNLAETYDQKTMFTMKACLAWFPLMCFSRAYNLPYSIKYLQLCAESNKWLVYLIFSQWYQIPKYLVISGLEHFTDIGLKQHLEYALHSNISTRRNSILQSTSTKVKDAFKKTENKISSFISSSSWFKKKRSKKTIEQSTKKSDSSDENDSEEFEENNNQNENKIETLEYVDFYELVLDCEKSPNPILRLQIEALKWKTPVLAVFATSYQEHDVISLLCTFLYASMKIPFNLQQSKLDSKNKSILFDLSDLKDAIQIAATRSYLRTLSNSLRIFIPKSILDIYMEFLYFIFRKKDSNMALKLYSMYKTELIKSSLNKHQLLIPIEWSEEVINKLTRIVVLKCQTIDDLNTLSKLLGPENEYERFIKLIYTLKSNNISVNCDNWLDMYDKSDQFNEVCFKCIEELLKIQKFDEAEKLADFCGLSKDRIHLARFANQIKMLRLNNDFDEILDFWRHAHIELMKIGIKDSDFIDFLKFQNSQSSLVLEKIVLLNLICQLVPSDNESSKSLRHLLFQFVLEHKKKNEIDQIHDIFEKMLLFGKHSQDPIKELVEYVIKEGKVNDFSDTNQALNEQDKDALNILLYNLVDIGKLAQAYMIAKYFKYYNQDFRILLNMIYICLDMINPEELDYSNQPIDTTSFKTTKLTNVLRSLSRPNETLETSNAKMQFLDKLVYLCNYGSKFSKRIKLDFFLSNEILNVPYTKLLSENQWVLLKNILYSQNQNKFSVAKEFVKIYDLNISVLADFVLNEFLLNLKTANDPNSVFMLDPFDSNQFSKLVKIFDNEINTFGNKLLEKIRQLLTKPKSSEDFTILTELIIRSHDCFTQSCSMEGISNVLQACKICAGKMLKAEEFNLMIRLLIEIGHYNEMTYIMDYLWDNQHFDMLIGKGKDNKLRLALLNYLKRYHPNDHNTYTMITLHFTMHREIAKMLEDAAYEQLKLLEDKVLENTSEILTDLQSITAYFSDAAKSFLKEDSVKQAEICIKKARLVALQIKILSTGIQIVNLNQASVTKFLTGHTNFWEAYIVAEAYERMTDLSLALFNQFIINNNVKYFEDFKTYLTINQNTVEEIVNRYKMWIGEGNNIEEYAIENVKILLKCCKDIGFFYRMASNLDLREWAMKEASNKKYLSILTDMIINKKI